MPRSDLMFDVRPFGCSHSCSEFGFPPSSVTEYGPLVFVSMYEDPQRFVNPSFIACEPVTYDADALRFDCGYLLVPHAVAAPGFGDPKFMPVDDSSFATVAKSCGGS